METKQMYSNLTDFAEWLQQRIDERHITVTRLSQISGVHPNTIRNYLAHRCEPTYYNVLLLVDALGYKLEAVKK